MPLSRGNRAFSSSSPIWQHSLEHTCKLQRWTGEADTI
uniref:Uncharacterized protein n=1 Tax=Anguilla anguilla TaxID=7936 RepID=A0A0E9VPG6_ANGAN